MILEHSLLSPETVTELIEQSDMLPPVSVYESTLLSTLDQGRLACWLMAVSDLTETMHF